METAALLRFLERLTAALASNPELLKKIAEFMFENGLAEASKAGDEARAKIQTIEDAERIFMGRK